MTLSDTTTVSNIASIPPASELVEPAHLAEETESFWKYLYNNPLVALEYEQANDPANWLVEIF